MSPRIILPLLSLVLAGTAQATLVNIAANTLADPATNIFTTTGSPLPDGNAVRIGTFPSGAPLITAGSTFASINALFVPLGENAADPNDGVNSPVVISSSTFGAGGYGGTINGVQNTDARFLADTLLYVFILDADYGNLGAATQWALFRDNAWTIPTSGTRALTTSQIDSQSEVLAGTLSAGRITLAPIPEVSSTVLILTVAGLASVHRRRK